MFSDWVLQAKEAFGRTEVQAGEFV